MAGRVAAWGAYVIDLLFARVACNFSEHKAMFCEKKDVEEADNWQHNNIYVVMKPDWKHDNIQALSVLFILEFV